MIKSSARLLDLITLPPDQKFSEEQINSFSGVSIISHRNKMFKVNGTPLHTVMSEMKSDEKFFNKHFGEENGYQSNLVYVLKQSWDQFKINKDVFRFVMKYFQMVYDEHKVEAAVYLMLNMETKEWVVLGVPQLNCSGAAVNYLLPKGSIDEVPRGDSSRNLYEAAFEDEDMKNLMQTSFDEYQTLMNEGFIVYGTIHSHCNFGAFHSGTDDADEKTFDGLHITIGNVRSGFSFSSRYMLSGAEWKKDILEVVDAASIEELKENLDDVVVNQYYMDLMKPDLGRRVYKQTFSYGNGWSQNNNSSSEYSRNWLESDFNNNSFSWTPSDSIDSFNRAEYNDAVFTEREMQRLYDMEDDKIINVSWKYYAENRESVFPESRFVRLKELEPSKELRKKRSEFLKKKNRKTLKTK